MGFFFGGGGICYSAYNKIVTKLLYILNFCEVNSKEDAGMF